MEVRIQKWGNSFGIRIPRSVLKSLDIKDNDLLTIEEKDDKIIISNVNKKKISLAKKFFEYHGDTSNNDFIWDDARGREIH